MENNDIAPAPVSTTEELFAKMDMLIGATRQWTCNDDNELAAIIYRRVTELPTDARVIRDPEHVDLFNQKASTLNHAFRQKAFINLQALNSLN